MPRTVAAPVQQHTGTQRKFARIGTPAQKKIIGTGRADIPPPVNVVPVKPPPKPRADISAQAQKAPVKHFSDHTGWRIEVMKGGKYFQWRKGRGAERKAKYGGKFRDLSDERKAAYEENRKTKSRRKPGDIDGGI